MAQPPTRVDSFADGGSQGDTEPGAARRRAPGADLGRRLRHGCEASNKLTTHAAHALGGRRRGAGAVLDRAHRALPRERRGEPLGRDATAAAAPARLGRRDRRLYERHRRTTRRWACRRRRRRRKSARRTDGSRCEHHPDRTRGVDRMARVNAAYAASTNAARAAVVRRHEHKFGRFDGARRRARRRRCCASCAVFVV